MAAFTSHDVRKLHTCSECGKLGVHGADLATRLNMSVVVRVDSKNYAHPKCMQVETLILLPIDELGNVRLVDVSSQVMKTILRTFA